MKRRKFLTNTSLALAGLSVPLGLPAMTASSAMLTANEAGMLTAFQTTLTDYPGPVEFKSRLATIASIEFSDATTLRFRSLSGERCEVRRVGDQVVTRLLESTH